MNYKLIGHYLGRVMTLMAVFLLLPLLITMIFRDFGGVLAFAITIALLLAAGYPLVRIKYDSAKLYAKEGLVIVAASWLILSLFGALPFYFSGEIGGFANCVLESISGFTTTGISIVPDMNELSKGLLFWRSFSQWIGGMGVLVFLLAVLPSVAGERALHVMKAEAPGPSPGKLVPRMRQSSRILYIIYLVLTLVEVVLLAFGGMPFFDAVITAMGTAGTGGFSAVNGTLAVYNNVFCEGVITVFMILFGINFNLYYFILLRQFKVALRNEELRVYFGVIALSTALIAWNLTGTVYASAGESLRHALFHVVSFISTTGFSSAGFGSWPAFSRTILFVLMFIGGCAGSTACGLKVSRIILMAKECRRTIGQMVRPRSVELVKLDGKPVEKSVVESVCQYGIICAFVFFLTVIILSLENRDMATTFSAAATALNNIGQGFGELAPGGAGIGNFSIFSKIVLCFNMLLGRLELYPLLIMFAPRTWKKV